MATRNDVTGDVIASRGNSEQYKNNWDLIFGKKKSESQPEPETPVKEEEEE